MDSILDVIGSLEEIMATELDGLKAVQLDHFKAFTEGYTPKGQVLYNLTNVVLTDRADFDYYRFYVKANEIVAEMSFPHHNLNLYVLSHINSAVLTNALNP